MPCDHDVCLTERRRRRSGGGCRCHGRGCSLWLSRSGQGMGSGRCRVVPRQPEPEVLSADAVGGGREPDALAEAHQRR